MSIITNQMLWRQFGAAIDTLADALRSCPDDLWEKQLWQDHADQWVAAGFSTFWYLAYHTLFWLDLNLTGAEEGFMPPKPFDLIEMAEGEVLPPAYSRQELLDYLQYCRQKCRETIESMSSEQANHICRFPWGDIPFAELQIYSLRHVQEHAAQLHLFIGQTSGKSSEWAAQAQ
jgi:hypothetical protein